MPGETVEQLAKSFGIECARLVEQFAEAGFQLSPEDKVPPKAKQALLTLLKKNQTETAAEEPKKITLKRQSKTEIKVQGRKSTVSVVRKKRHIYVKREEAGTAEVLEEGKPDSEVVKPVLAAEEVTKTTVNEPVAAATELVPVIEEKSGVTESAAKKEERVSFHKKGRSARELLDDEEKKRGRSKPKKDDVEEWHKGKLAHVLDIVSSEEKEEVDEENADSRLNNWRLGKKTKAKSSLHKLPRKDIKGIVEEIQKKHSFEKPQGPLVKEILIPETITATELAQKMSVKVAEVIKVLMKLGMMVNMNQSIERDVAILVVEEMGHTPKIAKDTTVEETLPMEADRELLPRAPVVTVMGHVDHGKTSLLDYIRRTKVAAKEAGGITQHIGAYHVETHRGQITFLDTPGHAAFTAMRARGVKCTDIVVLVVAADDGVMPQTIEAIQHAKAANIPIVVAINKIDKKEADLDRIQNELSVHGLVPEAWGGDVMVIPVSAKIGTGIDNLLEAISLQAEILELKAPTTGQASGVVLEARLDKGRGPIASLLVQKGKLSVGDILLAGKEYGRVRALINELGQQVSSIGPSMPGEALGLSNVPQAGDSFVVVADERKAREVALFRESKHRDVRMLQKQSSKLDSFFGKLQQGESKALNIILKTDVQGSAEALMEALEGLSTDEVKVKIVAANVGGINESDVSLALASDAVLIGFNVRADTTARRLAEKESVEIYYSSIIYEIVDNVKRAMSGLLGPQFKETILGLAEVRDVFRSAKLGAIAGCMVIEGTVKRGYPIRVLRNNIVIYQGELESLRRFKDDVSEVRNGMECGIGVKNYNDVKPGDQIEVYENVQVSREIA